MTNLLDVLIIGAGPTGLTAANEAIRHGLSVRIIDKNDHRSIHSKALVAHSRTLEVFTDMGIISAVLGRGQKFHALNIHTEKKQVTHIVFQDLDWQDAPYPFWLSIPQSQTELCLEEHLHNLGGTVERQMELVSLEQQGSSVRANLRNNKGQNEVCEAAWVIGCDGARSATRKLLGSGFEGMAKDEVFVLADVKLEEGLPEDEGQTFLSGEGIVFIVPLPEPQAFRIIAHMPDLPVEATLDITLEFLQTLIAQRVTLPARIVEVGWTSHFSVKHFVVPQHRQGQVFLAGDAAHIHSPVGGQGLNTGIQDAYNLMWKLALVHQGKAVPALLDSYHAERHAIAESMIKNISRATDVITLNNPIAQRIRNQLAGLIINTEVFQNRMGRKVGMLDISYRDSPIVVQTDPTAGLRDKVSKKLGKGSAFQSAPAAGDRAPNVNLTGQDPSLPQRLLDVFCGTHHTLLIFAGAEEAAEGDHLSQIATQIQKRYKAEIKPVIVTLKELNEAKQAQDISLVDADGEIHRYYGADTECLYLIRPDHYIAYRSQIIDLSHLFEYLDHIFVLGLS